MTTATSIHDKAPAVHRRRSTTGGPVTAGIDWASTEHAVSIVDEDGIQIDRWTVPHTSPGLTTLIDRLTRRGVTGVGIERTDGQIVDALLAADLPVYVIPPNQIASLRRRYGAAGNKDDRFDAYVLADTVRTDQARLTPLEPDTPATVSLRMSVRARADLVAARIALTNQLRAHLAIVLPAAIGLFRDLDSAISLAFLTRFTTQDQVDWLSTKRLHAWLRSQRYPNPARADMLYPRIEAAAPGTRGPEGAARAAITLAFVATLQAMNEQIRALEDDIAAQLAGHPDGPIFTSLPKAGTIRAARLLAEIGDSRGRYPTPQSLVALAGAAPSTKQSGKAKVVTFRYVVDKQLRGAVMDFAGDSHHANAWAEHRYRAARDRGKSHSHATRIVARAWLHIIWNCWQNHEPYDPAKHRAYQALQATA